MTIVLLITTLLSSAIAIYFWAQTVRLEKRRKAMSDHAVALTRTGMDLEKALHDMTLDRDWLQGQLNAERHAASQRPASVVEGVLGRLGGWFG